MQIGLLAPTYVDPSPAIAYSLVQLLSHGKLGSKILFPDLLPKPSIGAWLPPPVNCNGVHLSFKNLMFQSISLCLYGVTIKPLCTSLIIRSSTNLLNTLRLIFILCARSFRLDCFFPSIFPPLLCRLTFLPSHSLGLCSIVSCPSLGWLIRINQLHLEGDVDYVHSNTPQHAREL